MTYINISLIKTVSYVFLIIAFYLLSTPTTHADDSYGWFTSKVDYVDTSLPVGCDSSTKASLEIWLVERGTKTPLNNSIGAWNVSTRVSQANDVLLSSNTYNATTTSNRICFDPTLNGIKVTVSNSTNYKPFISPVIFPGSSDGTLNSLVGNHFRGYVELDPITSNTPSVSSISPSGGAFNVTPNFVINTQSPSTLFSSISAVKSTKIYVFNQTTNQNSSYINDTDAGFNTNNSFTGPSGLVDGVHYWTFHQILNGSADTTKYTFPAKTWNFSRIPASGVPSPMSFVIDKTPPVAVLSAFSATQLSSDGLYATSTFTRTLSDNYSGLGQTQLFITKAGVTTAFSPTVFSGPVLSSKVDTITLGGIERGVNYLIYYVTMDRLGNTSTSSVYTYNLPLNLDKPTVALYNYSSTFLLGTSFPTHNSVYLYGIVTNASTNPTPTTRVGRCWSTSLTDLQDENNIPTSLCSDSAFNPGTGYWYNYVIGLPASTTIYFRMKAQNQIGWGYSPIGSFNTPPSPYVVGTSTPTIPVVSYSNPLGMTGMTSLDPHLRISSAGYQEITNYGICYDTDRDTAYNLNPINLLDSTFFSAWSTRCSLLGPLATTTSLPFDYRYGFTGLIPNTDYYFNVFAINSLGAGVATGTYKTKPYLFDFRNQTLRWEWYASTNDLYPKFSTSSAVYNPDTNTFDNLKVILSFYDWSTQNIFPLKRTIDYEFKLYINNNPIPDYITWGTSSAPRRDLAPATTTITLNNIPAEVPITVTSEANRRSDGTETFPQTSTTSRLRSATIQLENPNTIINSTSGSDDSSGSFIDIDPNFSFLVKPNITRSGRSAEISWNMLNLNINCEINGPNGFNESFNPSINGILDTVTGRKYGTTTTPILFNTQIFELTCTNSIGTTYTTSSRVNVVGNIKEL